jgi:hypothetical protein
VEQADSEAYCEQIHAWTRECVDDHYDSCPRPQVPSPLPTRVIDVSLVNNPKSPRVLETRMQPGTFVALSHCWGSTARFVLDSNIRTELLSGIAMATLPPTFRDAIKVTRALGYPYLWINSLSILQDSHADWDVESSRMRDYYMNAILTIALDDTQGDHVGFLDQHRMLDKNAIAVPFCISETDERGQLSSKVLETELVYFSYDRRQNAPQPAGRFLTKHGWTLQEDILAVRTVHYGFGRLRWDCQKHRRLEGLVGEFDTSDLMKPMFYRGSAYLVIGHKW